MKAVTSKPGPGGVTTPATLTETTPAAMLVTANESAARELLAGAKLAVAGAGCSYTHGGGGAAAGGAVGGTGDGDGGGTDGGDGGGGGDGDGDGGASCATLRLELDEAITMFVRSRVDDGSVLQAESAARAKAFSDAGCVDSASADGELLP